MPVSNFMQHVSLIIWTVGILLALVRQPTERGKERNERRRRRRKRRRKYGVIE